MYIVTTQQLVTFAIFVIDLQLLLLQVVYGWIEEYGHILHSMGGAQLDECTDIMDDIQESLRETPTDLESLKALLQTIHACGQCEDFGQSPPN